MASSEKDEPQGRQEFDITILPPAMPSLDSSPNKPLVIEDLSAPEWSDWDEAVAWFVQLRAAVKSIVYRFVTILQEAREIFERNDATHFSNYLKLGSALEKLWSDWKCFITQNGMTTDFLHDQNFLAELKGSIKYMKTPKRAAIRSAQSKMESLRSQARFIAIEAESVRGFMEEATIRLEEQDEGHNLEKQFPKISEYSDVPDPRTLQEKTEARPSLVLLEETEEQVLARGGFRDQATLDVDSFHPVWISGEEFLGEMSDELREMIGNGHGKYHYTSPLLL
jgi:hypothetical protein